MIRVKLILDPNILSHSDCIINKIDNKCNVDKNKNFDNKTNYFYCRRFPFSWSKEKCKLCLIELSLKMRQKFAYYSVERIKKKKRTLSTFRILLSWVLSFYTL